MGRKKTYVQTYKGGNYFNATRKSPDKISKLGRLLTLKIE